MRQAGLVSELRTEAEICERLGDGEYGWCYVLAVRRQLARTASYIHPSLRSVTCKIGCTRVLTGRVLDVQAASADILTLVAAIPGYADVERAYHQKYAEFRAHHEWFHLPIIEIRCLRLEGIRWLRQSHPNYAQDVPVKW